MVGHGLGPFNERPEAVTEVSFEYAEVSIVTVRIPDSAMQRRQRLQAAGCCTGCERKLAANASTRRGLCSACYQAAVRAIAAKKVSANQLMREGKMLPASKGGRPSNNQFTKSLSEL